MSSGAVVIPSPSFDETLSFFVERLGFRIERISPADDPSVADLAAHGMRVRLDRSATATPPTLVLPHSLGELPAEAPGGTRLEVATAPALHVPDLVAEPVLTRGGEWGEGRAGMLYRDLIPSRLGGRFIASHIRIVEGGPVPDYVHHHHIRFQLIFCRAGWVDVVYEDQGPPFRLLPGDAVIQPPHIRHRVLESAAETEVVEIGCPADHDTFVDHQLELPTAVVDASRDFDGQRFVRHQSDVASWAPWRESDWTAQDMGIDAATNGLAEARLIRAGSDRVELTHGAEFVFFFVLSGGLEVDGQSPLNGRLVPDDSFVVPAAYPTVLSGSADATTLLEVSLPGAY